MTLDYPELQTRFGDTLVEYKVAPQELPFVVHLSTYDEVKKSRPTLNNAPLLRPGTNKILAGLPDVYRYRGIAGNKEPEYIELTKDRQHYLLYINVTRYLNVRWSKDEYYKWFNAGVNVSGYAQTLTGTLTHDRSHTNFMGMDNCHNYLLGNDLDGLPKFSKILTGRARLKLYNGKREIKTIPGVGMCIAFHCIDASRDLWQWNWWDHPELFDEPCITGREVRFDKKDGHPFIWRDDLHYPYGAFGNKLIFPMWLPNSNKGFVLESLTRPLLPFESMSKFQ